MKTIDQKNSVKTNTDNKNQNSTDQNVLMNEELYNIDEFKDVNQSKKEIAEQGFTVRNGHDPNKPNPDEITNDEDDLDDLNDDFHTDKDLENDDNLDDLDEEIDIDGEERIVNDEFDNPSDNFNNTFNETEEDLEIIDDEIEEEDNMEYREDDIQEEDTEKDYPANDPRRF
ncbi:hypothetical protein ACEN2I_16270 [Flavobacterium sp. W22_SRS_FK3]|uniref:hypothetical protein n=1 Tax=Flavobacterium sp. W22_SRS_FK3 TaxID=3240275 RepID=UPI003F90EB71